MKIAYGASYNNFYEISSPILSEKSNLFSAKNKQAKDKIIAIPTNFRQNSLIIMYNVSINLHCMCITARFTNCLSKIFIETKDNKQLFYLMAYDSCNPFFCSHQNKCR